MQSQTYGGLAAYRQFIVWASEPETPQKTKKYAVNPATGYEINTHDPANWLSLEEAHRAAAAYTLLGPRVIRNENRPAQIGCGVGFVFAETDPFFFFDLDECRVGDDWQDIAKQMCSYFAGCYVEVSLSGNGLHIIGTATPPDHMCKIPSDLRRRLPFGMELYHTKRFCALTGTGAAGSALHVAQEQINWLVPNYFPPSADAEDAEWTDGPCPEWSGPTDDDALIARMLGAKGSIAALFGSRATVRDLWEGDPENLSKFYPPEKDGSVFNQSSADAALCQHLAFWTGKDCERIDRIFRLSGLYRDKWERTYYQQRTIKLAVGRCDTVLGARDLAPAAPGEQPVPVNPQPVLGAPSAPIDPLTGELRYDYQFLGITQQQEHFAGCVYVRDSHCIYTPDGALLNSERFNATYGGYSFALDLTNDKTTRKAWEAFTESQAFHFPKVHGVCFRPECESGALIPEEGYTLVNTYVPITTRRESGDPAPFLDLVRRLLPEERDRQILLSYMAAMLQYPGVKFQWWPVVQGTEGNGKSALIRVLTHAVGNRYSHLPSPESMAKTGNQFNGWIEGRLFLGLEEIYMPERRDFLEAFKTTVTNDRIQIEGKGSNQRMGDNRANGMMCTNHQDGVPITVDTRRYCIFFTAQQSKEDKRRDGMVGGYFPELYDWFTGRGQWAAQGRNYGYAVVNDFLCNYKIAAEFNPAGICQEAPVTSSTGAAVKASMGAIEQEILEAVEEGRPGFAGGWISSRAFDNLLEQRGAIRRIPPARRRDMLRSMNYDLHPHLLDGRVSNPIPDPAGHGRPRLYLRQGHLAINLTKPADIARLYLEAQQSGGVAASVFGQQGVAG